jgi:hypothetical protein
MTTLGLESHTHSADWLGMLRLLHQKNEVKRLNAVSSSVFLESF